MIEKKNILWNMIGSLTFAFATMYFTIIVARMLGDAESGMFSFAFIVGQQFYALAHFGMRSYMVTDIDGEFSFKEYLQAHYVTCGLTVLGGIGFLLITGYTMEKALLVFLLIFYKMLDGFADGYEGEFQRRGRLYLSGYSLTFRTLISGAVFTIALAVTKNLIAASAGAVISGLVGIACFNLLPMKKLEGVDWSFRPSRWWRAVLACLPIAVATFMDAYVFSAAKYGVNSYISDEASLYFQALFLPATIIPLLALFVIRPFVTQLAYFWGQKQYQRFLKMVAVIAFVLATLSVGVLLGGYFLGIPVLNIIYGRDFTPYLWPFMIIILGGAFNAMNYLFNQILVVFRKQSRLVLIYGIGSLAALVITKPMILAYGMIGGAWSYCILMILQMLLFAGITCSQYVTLKKRKETE